MKNTYEHSKMGSDINEHLLPLYSLVLWLNAKRVLELGVRTGESTLALGEGVLATGGRLYSVDIEDSPDAVRKADSCGFKASWTFVKSDDIKFGLGWPKDVLFDLIFIDTSHQYEHTKSEIEIFDPLLRPGGIMAFHDTVSHPEGVLKPMRDFVLKHPGYQLENLKNQNGLGVIRKPW